MAEYIQVYYQKFWEHAKEPTRATPFSVGSDLYSAFEYCIPRKGQTTVDTGVGVIIPPAYQGHIMSKSKLAHEHSLHVGAGAVDPDYIRPIFVVVNNHSDKDYLLKQGEAIAQIVYQKVALPIYEEVQQLPSTLRGRRGLGTADTF